MMRALKNRFTGRWASALVGAAICVFVTLFIWESKPLGQWLAGLSYDLLFRFRGNLPTDGATVVSMDEESYRALEQKPGETWDHRLHATLLDRTFALGARAVVFDIWFADPSPNPEQDRRFIDSLRARSGKVVVAAKVEERREGGTNQATIVSELLPPTEAIASIAPWGVVNLPLESDGRIRRHYVHPLYVPLAWRAAEAIGEAPGDPSAARWINFYGPIPRKSYREVLQGTNALPPGFFSNQVIFVGGFPVSTPGGIDARDVFHTPITRWSGEPAPGVEVQATLFLNLIRNDWLTRAPRGGELALLAGCALVLGFGTVLMRPWVSAWAAPAAALLFAALAWWLMAQHRVWFPWLLISAVQIPCAFTWSVVAHTKWLSRQKDDLERKLATAIQAATHSKTARTPAVTDHTLIRCVGGGAYGDVWLARDLVGNYRAVKAIYRHRFPQAEPFEREFRGIEKFSPISRTHPGWVDILHIGRIGADEGFFYIMEVGDDEVTGAKIDPDRYVPRTLTGVLRGRKLGLEECVAVSIALADALVHLHKHSLIHRDIKPSNVIFVNGAPKFADIGLVTEFSSTAHDVSFLGTEGYIAPEGPGSPAADVFSLGKLIYEASTGRDRRAFPELPTELERGASDPAMEELYRIVLKACEFEVRHRYASAAELHADLLKLRERLAPQRPR